MDPRLADFQIHLAHPAPGFRCFECRDPAQRLRFTVRVMHQVNLGATPADLEELQQTLGPDCDDVRAFYAQHDGLTLYRDVRCDNAGITFFQIAQWKAMTEQMLEVFSEMGLDSLYGDLCGGVAIGEICSSGNYFVYQISRRRRGSIYYLMHDPAYDPPLSFAAFGALLESIADDPAQFLFDAGCYTRYLEGTGEALPGSMPEGQWIPKEYLPDVTGLECFVSPPAAVGRTRRKDERP
jgi:hypothetical protein